MAYTIGHVSGCHINPAVTLAFFLSRKVTIIQACYYWVAQFVGALIGGLIIYIASDAGDLDNTGIFAANGWGADIGGPFGLRLDGRRGDLLHRPAHLRRAVDDDEGLPGRLRRARRRPHARHDPPGDDPGRQHVGEPGTQLRGGDLQRHRRPRRSCGRSSSSRSSAPCSACSSGCSSTTSGSRTPSSAASRPRRRSRQGGRRGAIDRRPAHVVRPGGPACPLGRLGARRPARRAGQRVLLEDPGGRVVAVDPERAQVAEVGERVADRRHLPVEDRDERAPAAPGANITLPSR